MRNDIKTAAENMVHRLEHEAAGRHAEFMMALVSGMHSPECKESTFSVDLGSGNGIWEFHATRLSDLDRSREFPGVECNGVDQGAIERAALGIPDITAEEVQVIMEEARANHPTMLRVITADLEVAEAIDPGRVIPINWKPMPEGGE